MHVFCTTFYILCTDELFQCFVDKSELFHTLYYRMWELGISAHPINVYFVLLTNFSVV